MWENIAQISCFPPAAVAPIIFSVLYFCFVSDETGLVGNAKGAFFFLGGGGVA